MPPTPCRSRPSPSACKSRIRYLPFQSHPEGLHCKLFCKSNEGSLPVSCSASAKRKVRNPLSSSLWSYGQYQTSRKFVSKSLRSCLGCKPPSSLTQVSRWKALSFTCPLIHLRSGLRNFHFMISLRYQLVCLKQQLQFHFYEVGVSHSQSCGLHQSHRGFDQCCHLMLINFSSLMVQHLFLTQRGRFCLEIQHESHQDYCLHLPFYF